MRYRQGVRQNYEFDVGRVKCILEIGSDEVVLRSVMQIIGKMYMIGKTV